MSNLMGIMVLLIMLVGNKMHASIHSLFTSAGQCYLSVKVIDVDLHISAKRKVMTILI